MNRRNFIELLTAGGAVFASAPAFAFPPFENPEDNRILTFPNASEFSADVVIAGGGLGGFAAAVAALRNNLKGVLTEETDWIGGQITLKRI